MGTAAQRSWARTVVAVLVVAGIGLGEAGLGGARALADDAPVAAEAAEVAARAAWAADTDGLIVSRGGSGDLDSAAARAAELLDVEVQVDRSVGNDAVLLSLSSDVAVDAVEAAAAQLEAEGLVVDADADIRVFTTAPPDDPDYERQWNLRGRHGSRQVMGINVEQAWDRTVGSTSVVVSVLDTGIRDHPDLDGRLVAGRNFVERGAQPIDRGIDCDPEPGQPRPSNPTWHGLHVAGIVGAATGNGIGIAGVDHRARIQPVRVLSDCGGTVSDLIDGIRWAAGLSVPGTPRNPTPADVINMSLGGVAPSCPAPLRDAIRAANDAGAVVVAAVGNEDRDLADIAFVPASCEGTIAVSATSPRGDRAGLRAGPGRRPYANHGSRVDISAPGGDTSFGDWGAILSLSDGSAYSYKAGTSMAAPQVSGVVALLRARDPGISPRQVRRLLMDTAQPFPLDTPGATWRCGSVVIRCGAGILDAGAALAARPTSTPRFSDAAGEHAQGIAWMAAEGITLGCDTGGRRFCPHEPVTRAQMATFMARALHLTDGRQAVFADVGTGSTHAATIDAMRRERVTEGCSSSGNHYCPTDPVTREQMASFIRRAERYPAGSASRFFDVRPGSTHAGAIGAMYREGVTQGCGTVGDRFCPDEPVTRGQMASFLHRALG